MTTVSTGSKVKIHYTGKFDDGEIFDSSKGGSPLAFEVGTGQVISGFDQAVIGMQVGETKEVHLQEDEAYGPYNQEMVFPASPDQFEDGLIPEIGQQFQTEMEDGTPLLLTVKSAQNDEIILDANHPMAGKALNFHLEVISID